MNSLLVICGPTATGKTDLALSLARIFRGEIINADSRQVYRGMDIGTGKDIEKNQKSKIKNQKSGTNGSPLDIGFREKEGIPIWLVDVVEPDYSFNVSEYVRLAQSVIADIWTRGKLPILVGGTGFYIKALINPPETLHVPPDEEVRKRLDKMSVEQLQQELTSLNVSRFQAMNDSDRNNPRRLVRAIEIVKSYSFPSQNQPPHIPYVPKILSITLTAPLPDLYRRIDARVEERYRDGVIDEIRSLLKKGYTWDLPAFSGCGYRVWQPFFEGNGTEEKIIDRWKNHEHAYARRQLTWFRKQKDILWFDITEKRYKERIGETVREWYTKNG